MNEISLTKLYLVFFKRPYYVRFSIIEQLVCCSFCCYKDMYLVLIVQAFLNIYFQDSLTRFVIFAIQ